METSVLVAGAGPVGLFMAASLQRLGIKTRLIDKATAPSDRSKALVVWPRSLEMLEIQGCAQNFVTAGLKAVTARVMAGPTTLASVSLAAAGSAFPFALMLPQTATERLLTEEFERLGGQVERGVELAAFSQDATGVTAELLHEGDRSEPMRVDWLVGCDGAHSTVRHGLGLEFTGVSMPSTWMLADVRVVGELGVEVLVSWSPEGVLAIFPIEPGRFRIIGDLGADTDRTHPPDLAEVQALVDRRGPGGLTLHDPVWLNTFRINERKVSEYRVGRIFLAGDAAHVHSPAGGQGMNTGLQDAANLAWKLALVAGGANQKLLDSYSPERSAIGDIVLRQAGRMTRIAILRNRPVQLLRNELVGVLARLPALRRRMGAQLAEIDLSYPNSPLNGGADRHAICRPGERIARPGLAAQSRSGRFVVLNGAPLPEEFSAIAVNGTLDGFPAGTIHVVRPDGYLAMSTSRDDEAQAYLAALQKDGLRFEKKN